MLHNDQAGCHADDSFLHGLDAGIVINRTDLDDFASVFKGAVQDVQDLLSRPPVVAGVTHHALYCHLSAESCTAHSSHAWLSFNPPPQSPWPRVLCNVIIPLQELSEKQLAGGQLCDSPKNPGNLSLGIC